MTCDLDALQAASLLQAMYMRWHWPHTVQAAPGGLVSVYNGLTDHTITIAPDLALEVARDIWRIQNNNS